MDCSIYYLAVIIALYLGLKDLFKGKVVNMLLMPGDRVFLSATPLESYNRVVRQFLPTFQLLSLGASFANDVK